MSSGSTLLFPHCCCLPRASTGTAPSSIPIYPMMSPIPVHPDVTNDLTSPSPHPRCGSGAGRGRTRSTSRTLPHGTSQGLLRHCGGVGRPGGSCCTTLGASPPAVARAEDRAGSAPSCAGGAVPAHCGHMRLAGADTVQLLRPLVSIAEFTTSPPAGWRRGGEHLEAIAAVTLQGDTAPQRGEPDPSPGSLLPPSAQQMSEEAASCHERGPAWS